MTDLAASVERHEREGWELSDRTDHRAVMINRDLGSPVVHGVVLVVAAAVAVTVFPPALAGNLVYAYYAYVVDADRRILRAETADERPVPGATPQGTPQGQHTRGHGSPGTAADHGERQRAGGRGGGGHPGGRGPSQSAGRRQGEANAGGNDPAQNADDRGRNGHPNTDG